jgi:hypothetical protein
MQNAAIAVCEFHAEICGMCDDVLSDLPVISSSRACKGAEDGSQQAPRTKERLTPRVDNRYVEV